MSECVPISTPFIPLFPLRFLNAPKASICSMSALLPMNNLIPLTSISTSIFPLQYVMQDHRPNNPQYNIHQRDTMSNRIPWCLVRTVNVGANYSLNIAPVKVHQPGKFGLPPYSPGNGHRKCHTALGRAFDVICYPRPTPTGQSSTLLPGNSLTQCWLMLPTSVENWSLKSIELTDTWKNATAQSVHIRDDNSMKKMCLLTKQLRIPRNMIALHRETREG